VAGEPRPQGASLSCLPPGVRLSRILTSRIRGTPPMGYRPSVSPSSLLTPSVTPSAPVTTSIVRACAWVLSHGRGRTARPHHARSGVVSGTRVGPTAHLHEPA
jgi:hypothetical protein